MQDWAKVDIEDALHLLSSAFACNPHYSQTITKGIAEVRKYAV